MASLQGVAVDAAEIGLGNLIWMTWNMGLALLPAVLAVLVFRHRARWGRLWGVGVAGFLLFLPNAPYVVTDLVHLRGDVALADTDAAVYFGVLPLYFVFIAVGFGCYAVCLREVGGWLRRTGRAQLVGATELGLHALSAAGVLFGRIARLNSWDTVSQPHGTLERAINTLTWSGSPIALVILFFVIWIGHATTRALVSAFRVWLSGHLPQSLGSPATWPTHPSSQRRHDQGVSV